MSVRAWCAPCLGKSGRSGRQRCASIFSVLRRDCGNESTFEAACARHEAPVLTDGSHTLVTCPPAFLQEVQRHVLAICRTALDRTRSTKPDAAGARVPHPSPPMRVGLFNRNHRALDTLRWLSVTMVAISMTRSTSGINPVISMSGRQDCNR